MRKCVCSLWCSPVARWPLWPLDGLAAFPREIRAKRIGEAAFVVFVDSPSPPLSRSAAI